MAEEVTRQIFRHSLKAQWISRPQKKRYTTLSWAKYDRYLLINVHVLGNPEKEILP